MGWFYMYITPLVVGARIRKAPHKVVPVLHDNGQPTCLTYQDCNLSGADFSNTTIYGLCLDRCNLSGARFDGAFLPYLDIRGCYWEPNNKPVFSGAVLWGSNLDYEPEPGSDHARAIASCALGDFTNADLTGTLMSFGYGAAAYPADNFRGAFLAGSMIQKVANAETYERVDVLLPPDGGNSRKPGSKRDRLVILREFLATIAWYAVYEGHGNNLSTVVGHDCRFGTARSAFSSFRLADPAKDRINFVHSEIARRSGRAFWAGVLYQLSALLNYDRNKYSDWARREALGVANHELISAMSSDAPVSRSLFSGGSNPQSVPDAQIFATCDLVLALAHERLTGNACKGMHRRDKKIVLEQLAELSEHFGMRAQSELGFSFRIPPNVDNPAFGKELMAMWWRKLFPGSYEVEPLNFRDKRVDCPDKNSIRNIMMVVDEVQPMLNGLRASTSGRVTIANWFVRNIGGPLDVSNMRFVDCRFYDCDVHMWNVDNTEFVNCSFDHCRFGSRRWGDVLRWGTVIQPGFRVEHAKAGHTVKGYPKPGEPGIIPFYNNRPVLRGCDLFYAKVGSISREEFGHVYSMDRECKLPKMWSAEYRSGLKPRGRKPGISPKTKKDLMPVGWDGDKQSYDNYVSEKFSQMMAKVVLGVQA